jgi:hypothetical protein
MVSDQPGLAGTRELVAFALRLGLRRELLLAAGTPKEHFDLNQQTRGLAVRLGARDVNRRRIGEVVARKRDATSPSSSLSGPVPVPPQDVALGERPRRHSWSSEKVRVPWSEVPGSLHTCNRCGMTRQSVPVDGTLCRWRVDFGIDRGDGRRHYVHDRTPPCPGFRSPPFD